MYKYVYIATADLSEEESVNLAARIQNTFTTYGQRLKGYIVYARAGDTHFFVKEGDLHTNLDDHIKADTYEEYIQYVFENQLEN